MGATQAIEMIKTSPLSLPACPFFSMRIMQTESLSWIWDATLSKSQMDIQRSDGGCATHRVLDDWVTGHPADQITEMAVKEVFQRIQQQETPHAYI